MFKKFIAKVNAKAIAAAIKVKTAMENKDGSVTVEAAILIVVAVVVGAAYLESTTGLLTTLYTNIQTNILGMFGESA